MGISVFFFLSRTIFLLCARSATPSAGTSFRSVTPTNAVGPLPLLVKSRWKTSLHPSTTVSIWPQLKGPSPATAHEIVEEMRKARLCYGQEVYQDWEKPNHSNFYLSPLMDSHLRMGRGSLFQQLTGDAESGKSTIAYSVARHFDGQEDA